MKSSHSNNIQYSDKCPLTQLIYELEQNFSIFILNIYTLVPVSMKKKEGMLVSCKHT